MNKSKFSRPPLSSIEKEKKAEDFLNFYDSRDVKPIVNEIKDPSARIMKKEPTKSILIRLPKSLSEDILEISAITGLSMNSVCIELLRPAAKNKLKDLKE